MRITSTANAGVIITTTQGSVGIDALHNTPTDYFSSVSEQTFEQIMDMDVDALIYTHDHPDHHTRELTDRYTRSRNTRIFAPFEGYELLGQSGSVDLGFASFEYKRLLHDGERFADVVNVAIVLTMEGKRILLPGDTAIEAPGFVEFAEDIDIFLCNFPFVSLNKGRDIIKQIGAKCVIAQHLPYEDEDTAGFIKSVQRTQRLQGIPDDYFIRPLQSTEV